MKIAKRSAVKLFVALGLKNADKWNDARMAAKLAKVKEMVDEDVKLEDDDQGTLNTVLAAITGGEEFEVFEDGTSDGTTTAELPSDAELNAADKAEKAAAREKQTAANAEAKAAKEAAKAKEKADKEAERVAAKAEKEATKAEEKAAKAAKAAAKAAEKAEKEPRETKAFLAGQIAAKVGLANFKRIDIEVMYGGGYSKAIVDVTYYRTQGGLRGFCEVPETRPGRLYLAGKLLKENGLNVTEELVKKLDEAYGKPNQKESQTALNHTRDAARGFLSVAPEDRATVVAAPAAAAVAEPAAVPAAV